MHSSIAIHFSRVVGDWPVMALRCCISLMTMFYHTNSYLLYLSRDFAKSVSHVHLCHRFKQVMDKLNATVFLQWDVHKM